MNPSFNPFAPKSGLGKLGQPNVMFPPRPADYGMNMLPPTALPPGRYHPNLGNDALLSGPATGGVATSMPSLPGMAGPGMPGVAGHQGGMPLWLNSIINLARQRAMGLGQAGAATQSTAPALGGLLGKIGGY